MAPPHRGAHAPQRDDDSGAGMTLGPDAAPGPPSHSLGFDPIDHDVIRKPPRKKNEPIIPHVIFTAASVIVFGTLFLVDAVDLVPLAARARLHPLNATDIPDRGTPRRSAATVPFAPRGPPQVRRSAEPEQDVRRI
ncbi:hypothetical protein EI94DRAFT_1811473 [Lactarius quietus]|nr:hypothetical protein EI94DRAFT_1811473 [Lactarius quietus]